MQRESVIANSIVHSKLERRDTQTWVTGMVLTCFLHWSHGSMCIVLHMVSTVLESAIVFGKGSAYTSDTIAQCVSSPRGRGGGIRWFTIWA